MNPDQTKAGAGIYGADPERARSALERSEVPVAVYGLGKMGLPLAAVFADETGAVEGVDVDEDVVETVNAGRSHVEGEPGLDALVADCVADGSLTAAASPRAAAARNRVHVVIVPTLVDDENEPDLSAVLTVATDIATGLAPGDLVILESTVPPRTCEDVLAPLVADRSGLSVGEFGLAFCPERTSSGRAIEDIRGAYPKVVGGVDETSAVAATVLYERINDAGVQRVADATTSEAVKVFEGAYRDVNIALANELGRATDELGIDVNEAIETANATPFCDIHDPGPGVGGHCIPYYPYFLTEPFESPTPLLETARDVNDSMPRFTVDRLESSLDAHGIVLDGAPVLVAGCTYRAGVEEIRAAPAIEISDRLGARGAEVTLVDPILEGFDAFTGEPIPLSTLPDLSVDAVVLVTAHEEFDEFDWDELEPQVVIDGRQSVDRPLDAEVYRIGSGFLEREPDRRE